MVKILFNEEELEKNRNKALNLDDIEGIDNQTSIYTTLKPKIENNLSWDTPTDTNMIQIVIKDSLRINQNEFVTYKYGNQIPNNYKLLRLKDIQIKHTKINNESHVDLYINGLLEGRMPGGGDIFIKNAQIEIDGSVVNFKMYLDDSNTIYTGKVEEAILPTVREEISSFSFTIPQISHIRDIMIGGYIESASDDQGNNIRKHSISPFSGGRINFTDSHITQSLSPSISKGKYIKTIRLNVTYSIGDAI